MGLFDNFNPNMLQLGAQLFGAGQGGSYPFSQGAPNQWGRAGQALGQFGQNQRQSQLFQMQKQQMEAEARKQQAQENRKAALKTLFTPGATYNQQQGIMWNQPRPGAQGEVPAMQAFGLDKMPQGLRQLGGMFPEAAAQMMLKRAAAGPPGGASPIGKLYDDLGRARTPQERAGIQARIDQVTTGTDGTQTEMDKTRASLGRQGYTQPQIDLFMTNKDRFQTLIAADGTTTVTDRYTNKVVPRHIETPAPPAALPETDIPEGGYQQGSGPLAAGARILNTLTDAVGAGLVFPESEKAYEAIHQLHNEIVLKGTAEIPGRPTNQIRELLESKAPKPGNIFFGEERNLGRVKATRRIMGDEMARMESMLKNPLGLSAKDRTTMRTNLSQLRGLRAQLDRIIENYRPKKDSGGGSPSVSTQEEYNLLPPGSQYTHPDGTTRRKK